VPATTTPSQEFVGALSSVTTSVGIVALKSAMTRGIEIACIVALAFTQISAFRCLIRSSKSYARPDLFSVLHQRAGPSTSRLHTLESDVINNITPTYKPLQIYESTPEHSETLITTDSNAAKVRKGSAPEFAIAGDSTVETPSQVAIVAAHFGMVALNLVTAASATQVNSPYDVASVVATIVLSVIVGDFGTGVFHWATDNYGSIKTPVFGSVCAAFQGHHVTPWTITFRSFANNVYKICYGTVPALLVVAAVPMMPLTKIFFTLFITWWMISQELHKFSHMRTTPKGIKYFQDMGLILSKKEHGLHHTAPFEGHYCILTGVCNSFLDDSKFFRHLENIVYKLTGNSLNLYLLLETL
jgi:palmitoyl-[glycerolipid] 3-(E)-desaturase